MVMKNGTKMAVSDLTVNQCYGPRLRKDLVMIARLLKVSTIAMVAMSNNVLIAEDK